MIRFFQIRLVEEPGKEDEVGGVHDQTQINVPVTHVTRDTILLHLISMNVHYYPDNHLDELEARDCYGDWLRDPDFECLQPVVGVHEWMDQEVGHDVPPCRSDVLRIGVPGIEQNGDVVIPMEKD